MMGEAPAPSPALKEAVRVHQAGDLGRAEALYKQAVAAAPDDAHALHLLGVLCHQKGQSALGVGHIERALMVRPDSALFHRNLAGILHALRRSALAASHYAQALEHGIDAHHGARASPPYCGGQPIREILGHKCSLGRLTVRRR